MIEKVSARRRAKLRAAREEHMAVIGSETERIKPYFCAPRIEYAA